MQLLPGVKGAEGPINEFYWKRIGAITQFPLALSLEMATAHASTSAHASAGDISALSADIIGALTPIIKSSTAKLIHSLTAAFIKRFNLKASEVDSLVTECDKSVADEIVLLRNKEDEKHKKALERAKKKVLLSSRPTCNHEFGERSKKAGMCDKPSDPECDNMVDVCLCKPHLTQYKKKMEREEARAKMPFCCYTYPQQTAAHKKGDRCTTHVEHEGDVCGRHNKSPGKENGKGESKKEEKKSDKTEAPSPKSPKEKASEKSASVSSASASASASGTAKFIVKPNGKEASSFKAIRLGTDKEREEFKFFIDSNSGLVVKLNKASTGKEAQEKPELFVLVGEWDNDTQEAKPASSEIEARARKNGYTVVETEDEEETLDTLAD